MLRKTLKRAGFGFLLGIAIGNFMAVLFFPGIVSASLLEKAGSLRAAFLWQSLLSGLFGAASFAGTSLYEIESWSLLRTAIVHYLIIEVVYLPLAFTLGWIATATEALIFTLAGAVAYLIIFLILWAIYRAQVRKLDEFHRNQQGTQTNNDTGGQTK